MWATAIAAPTLVWLLHTCQNSPTLGGCYGSFQPYSVHRTMHLIRVAIVVSHKLVVDLLAEFWGVCLPLNPFAN